MKRIVGAVFVGFFLFSFSAYTGVALIQQVADHSLVREVEAKVVDVKPARPGASRQRALEVELTHEDANGSVLIGREALSKRRCL